MKQTLLFILFSFFSLTMFGQFNPDGSDADQSYFFNAPSDQPEVKITIFPNPAINFISISNEDKVSEISVFNLVGRKIKTFEAQEGAKYDVSDLPQGMYLIQVMNHSKKVITTQRIRKR
ncbi:MAG: T9SS type A sorting domain-containing protein [Bacteroidetes bacterium]|jgi:hypothetical protein|nr:T9SS type A sorting domain-containing protein [Bacteroidota bacterium]MDF1863575.1 T9SS type A sorting domain-containing protein [Saprospiraceae bacterium]